MRARPRNPLPILALIAAHAAIWVAGSALHALPGLRHESALGSGCHAPAFPAPLQSDDGCAVCGLAQLAATPLIGPAPPTLELVGLAPPTPVPAGVPPRVQSIPHGRAPPRGIAA